MINKLTTDEQTWGIVRRVEHMLFILLWTFVFFGQIIMNEYGMCGGGLLILELFSVKICFRYNKFYRLIAFHSRRVNSFLY